MKSEIRKVTVEQEVYIADDGTEFSTEDSCEAYEIELKEKALTFYDGNFTRVDFDSCMYVRLDTLEQVNWLREICEWNGVTSEGLDDAGVYLYLDASRRERWLNLTPVIEYMTKEESKND